MAINQNIKTCRTCGNTGTEFRPQRRDCRRCERLKHLDWSKKQVTPIEALILEKEFIERERRKQYLAANPHLKWCENGSHFVERIQFSKGSKAEDGLQPKCKGCVARNRLANLAAIKESKKIYREQNREKVCAGMRDWYHNRCDKRRHTQQNKQWRKNNPFRYKELNREYYTANRERFMTYGRQRYLENRLQILEAQKTYYQANAARWRIHGQTRRARTRAADGVFTFEQWQGKLAYYGHRCYLCNTSLEGQIIHIEHRIPVSRGGTNWLANVAPACPTCNLRKGAKTEREFREHLKIVPN
jgi:5-methylcytosine-specific restriction endonuclease McrA